MNLSDVTPMILTFNEEPNIARVLASLSWADEIVIIDSYSTDRTLEIINTFKNTKVYQNEFIDFAQQCNYGLSKINTKWVLSIDADYVIQQDLVQNIKAISSQQNYDGYSAKFKYCIEGKPLKSTLYPPRTVLYKRNQANYIADGHAHKVIIDGNIGSLKGYIFHDDRKSLDRWLNSQKNYIKHEVYKLSTTDSSKLSITDRIRKRVFFAPFLVLIYCLIVKRGLLDGWRGWYYALQRMYAEVLLALHLIELKYIKNK